MRILISEVRATLKLRLYGPALITLFAIPDAAATVDYGLEKPPNRVRYTKWFNENVDPKASGMNGEFAWLMRNALLHETAVNWRSAGVACDRVIISVPSANGRLHNFSVMEKGGKPAGVLDLGSLSDAILAGATAWLDQVDQDPERKARLDSMIQYRPNGVGPIGGFPIIT